MWVRASARTAGRVIANQKANPRKTHVLAISTGSYINPSSAITHNDASHSDTPIVVEYVTNS